MRTMIAVPCMDMVHTDFMRSALSLEHRDETQFYFSQASLVYDGRNKLAEAAISGEFDRVLWLDSDVVFDRFLFRRLSEHLDLGREMITGLYFGRKAPIRPMIYRELQLTRDENGSERAAAENFDGYERDSLFRVAGCGFGAVMMTTELIRRVRDRFGLPFFPAQGFGEDLAFCRRVSALGTEIWCDSSIKLGHVGLSIIDEDTYRSLNGLKDD